MKVSLIVPVYNAAACLVQSLESIRLQSYKDLEICFIDDCSTDESPEILRRFKQDFPGDVIICRHETNRGVAAARNTGLDTVTGDYVTFLDADDALKPDAISLAVAAAENADIVGWDWILAQPGSERYMRQPDCKSPEDVLKALMNGTMRWNLWLFMARRSLYEGIRFIPGQNMGEDMMVMMRILMKAATYKTVRKALYRYEQTDSSVSKSMTERNISQVSANVAAVETALAASQYANLAEPYMDFLKQSVKLPLLVSSKKTDWKRWAGWFPESDKSVMLNKALPARTRILQYLGARHCWLGIRLYNMIYKCAYRIKFRNK